MKMSKWTPCVLVVPAVLLLFTSCQSPAPPAERLEDNDKQDLPLRLACRINSYGGFQDAAWDHLPVTGISYIFLNVPAAEEVENTKQRLKDSGLTAIVLRGETNLSLESSLAELEEQLAICQEMDVEYMFLSPKRHDATKETIYGRLREAGDIAEKYGVTIVLETHPDLGTNGDVHLETMRQINHPRVRVNFDSGNIHYYNEGKNAADELLKIVDYVATVEIKDHSGVYNEWNFPTLGQGIVDIPEVLRVLREHDYQGPITMEIEGIKGVDWDEETTKRAIEDSVVYLHSLGDFQ
jgi:sugar phosphate isomerase/epimerase